MSKREFTFIAPTLLDTKLTGLRGAGECIIRGNIWRATFWTRAKKTETVLTKNGKAIDWSEAPTYARAFAHEIATFISKIPI